MMNYSSDLCATPIDKKNIVRESKIPPGIAELLIASIFMLAIINGFLAEITNIFEIPYGTWIAYVLIYGLSLFAYFLCLLDRPSFLATVMGVFLVLIVLSASVTPDSMQYLFDFGDANMYDIAKSQAVYIFGLCVPMYLFSYQKLSLPHLYRHLYRYSLLATALFVMLMVLHILFGKETLNYMTVAYNALPAIAILFYDAQNNHRPLSSVLWICGFAGIVLGGCRGALLTLLVLFFIWWLRSQKAVTPARVILYGVVTVVAIITVIYMVDIVTALDEYLRELGYQSRLLAKFLGTSADGDLFVYSDRMSLQNPIIENLNAFGHGIFSDRILLDGVYPHNIVLEILYHFGWVFGLLILALAVFLLVRSNIAARRSQQSFLHFAWVSLVSYLCVKMMFSASYLSDRPLWFFIGVVALSFHYSKEKTQETTP